MSDDPGEVVALSVKTQLARLCDAMLEGLVVCSASGSILFVNDNLCRMLGQSREALVGKPAAQWLGDIHARALLAGPCAERSAERFEIELPGAGGASVIAQVSAHAIQSADGRSLGSFAVLLDNTAQSKALRHSESELRLLSAQLMAAQELERQRIARELHDSIGAALGGIKFSLENCQALIATGAVPAAQKTIELLVGKMHATLSEVRRIATELRPSTLDDLGVLPTIGWFTREFRALYTHVTLETEVNVCEEEIAPAVKTALYRIAQEALNNVVTHSGARKVALAIRSTGAHVELVIRDDGEGFNPADFAVLDASGRGFGLASMSERAESTGGRFTLESEPGRGTTVRARWPSFCSKRRDDSSRCFERAYEA
jgi:two-component system NarL family sensor kinase